MTYMEIATYLGLNAALLANNDVDENKAIMDNIRTALLEAQLVMYEMARKEMRGGTK